jgi:hypothetical protein
MPKLKLRRLFDIQTENVSLVDRAANMKSFLIMKRNKQQEREDSMEVTEALLGVENALNDLSSRVEKLEGGFFKFDTTELEKKGARFSKETILSLRALAQTLEDLIGLGTEKDEDVSTETAMKAITKGIQASFMKEDKKVDDIELAKKVATVLAEAIKSVQDEGEK